MCSNKYYCFLKKKTFYIQLLNITFSHFFFFLVFVSTIQHTFRKKKKISKKLENLVGKRFLNVEFIVYSKREPVQQVHGQNNWLA